MGALCHQPFGLGRQPSVCCVRLLVLGTTKAFVAFLASLGWRPSAAPTHYLDTLLMLLAGHLAKIQGLKGEFLFHSVMDEPDRLLGMKGLILAPPQVDLEQGEAEPPARPAALRLFRWHQERPCLAFTDLPDRTTAEPYKGWALWMPEAAAELSEGQSFRHQWIGCEVFVAGRQVGEVLRLESGPAGYDMVVMRDLRPGRTGQRDIPYIKTWWTLDLPNRRLELDPPEGLLDVNLVGD